MATLSIRTTDETKYSFEGFCESLGLTVSAAVNMFMRVSLRENRIPLPLPMQRLENLQSMICPR